MIDANVDAIRTVRAQAERLRLECIKVAAGAALLHIAYSQTVIDSLPADQVALLGLIK